MPGGTARANQEVAVDGVRGMADHYHDSLGCFIRIHTRGCGSHPSRDQLDRIHRLERRHPDRRSCLHRIQHSVRYESRDGLSEPEVSLVTESG